MSLTFQGNYYIKNAFLEQLKSQRVPLILYTVNGVQIRGTITAYDNLVVIVENEERQQMIYKHAISTISPLHKIDFPLAESNEVSY